MIPVSRKEAEARERGGTPSSRYRGPDFFNVKQWRERGRCSQKGPKVTGKEGRFEQGICTNPQENTEKIEKQFSFTHVAYIPMAHKDK